MMMKMISSTILLYGNHFHVVCVFTYSIININHYIYQYFIHIILINSIHVFHNS